MVILRLRLPPGPAMLNLANAPTIPVCDGHVHCNVTCIGAHGFNFTDLQLLTDRIRHFCPYDKRLARYPGTDFVRTPPALSPNAAFDVAGRSPTRYPYSDLYARITTWKIPLIQLAALFPRPPLGPWVELFVFVRLLGNPIGTLQDIILKFASCQGRALYWKKKFKEPKFRKYLSEDEDGAKSDYGAFQKYERCWKAFSIIVDSCDEWGREKGDYTESTLTVTLDKLFDQESEVQAMNPEHAQTIREECLKSFIRTAGALAADRCTTLFPVAVALALFMAVIVFAFVRTKYASATTTTVFINVEVYSVAFSALFFWILSLVPLGAAIGSSQTENAIPRILNRLELEINKALNVNRIVRIDSQWIRLLDGITENEKSTKSWARKAGGGIYSYQPANWPSARERFTRSSSDRIDEIKADIAGLHDDFHTPPCFPKISKKFWPNPIEVCKEYESSLLTTPFIWVGCLTLGSTYWISCFLSWICWTILCWIRFLTGPIVPGSPLFPFLVISSNLVAAWIITMRVPPRVFGCRPKWQLYLFLGWWTSWFLDCMLLRSWCFSWLTEHHLRLNPSPGPIRDYQRRLSNFSIEAASWINTEDADHALMFFSALFKDFLCVFWTFGDIVATQWGSMNRPDCYIDQTNTYLVLPDSPPVNEALKGRLLPEYLTLTLLLICLQLFIIPGVVVWQYYEALQVFVQRDDDRPHWTRRLRVRCEYEPWGDQRISSYNLRFRDSSSQFKRWWNGMPPNGISLSKNQLRDFRGTLDDNSFNSNVERKVEQVISSLSNESGPSTAYSPQHPQQQLESESSRRNQSHSSAGSRESTQDRISNGSSHNRGQSQGSNDPLLQKQRPSDASSVPPQDIELAPQLNLANLSREAAEATESEMNSPVDGLHSRPPCSDGAQ